MMNFAIRIGCTIIFLATSSMLIAQNVVIENPLMNDGTGRPQTIGPDMSVDGSPYLFDEYLPGEMTTREGVILRNYKLRFSLVDNTMYYLGADGKEMKLTTPIQSFRVFPGLKNIGQPDTVKVISLDKVLNAAGTAVYIAFAEGKMNFLKKINVTYSDKKEYGTTNVTRVFSRKESYVISSASVPPAKLVKTESGVLEYFGDKKNQIRTFVQSNKLSYRSDTDLASIFSYYNSL